MPDFFHKYIYQIYVIMANFIVTVEVFGIAKTLTNHKGDKKVRSWIQSKAFELIEENVSDENIEKPISIIKDYDILLNNINEWTENLKPGGEDYNYYHNILTIQKTNILDLLKN